MLLAGIDIGTLTCRLLIADIFPDHSMKEVESDRRILRLGEGVDGEGRLSHDAMARVVGALKEWQTRITNHHVAATIAVATSAAREAENRQEFLAWIKKETGFEVAVLSGEEEARQTFLGIQFGLPSEITDCLALDIGGGSTELILAPGREEPVVSSLDIGVVRLTERFFHSDPPELHEVKAAEQFILAEVKNIQPTIDRVKMVTLVGTAGTVTTLAAMAQRLRCYESARIHNYRLSLEHIHRLEKDLRMRTASERCQLPGLEGGREGVIIAGTVILRTVMEALGFEQCLVSDYGLREGILVHYATNQEEFLEK